MAASYSDDGYVTIKQISGDPATGFTWTAVDNIRKNESEGFSGQDLYLQGFGAGFQDLYVLEAPVYNGNQTVSYSSVTKFYEIRSDLDDSKIWSPLPVLQNECQAASLGFYLCGTRPRGNSNRVPAD
jgi:hypothetical protein